MDAILTAYTPGTTELAEKRVEAYPHLIRFWQSGNDRWLQRFVALVGEGGTFPSDFPVIPFEPTGGREALKPRCWRCGQRKALSSYRVDHRALHGHSPWCRVCERERAEGTADGRTWHRNPTGITRKVIPIDEPVIYHKTCEHCGREYETMHADQRYHSKQCRKNAQQRRFRIRQREAA